MLRVLVLLALVISSALAALAPVLGVDVGNEYMKISAIAPGHNLEMILNTQSKRKTRTVVNLAGQIRQFGESAFAQQTMQPNVTLQHWASNVGLPEDAKTEGFGSVWYPYKVAPDAKRHTVKVAVKDGQDLYFEELMAHQLSHGKELVKEHLKDISYADDMDVEAAFAIPVDFTYRQRQLLRQSANVAGLRPVGFVPEPLAAAISHTLDIPSNDQQGPRYKVFLDVGSKHTQACLVKFEFVPAPDSVRAGVGRQRDLKEVLSVETIRCDAAKTYKHGAHQLDVLIADHLEKQMLKKEKIKAHDVTPRSRRRLLKDANKVKHTLSTNKDANIFIEGYAKGKDLRATITRDDFNNLIVKSNWLDGIKGLKKSLATAFQAHREANNLPPADFAKSLDSVELIGGGWRVPKVLSEIESIFAPAPPGQKCNSDEAMAVGAAMVAANHSSTYKFRPILATTILNEPLFVEIQYQNEDNKPTKLELDFPTGTRYGASRKRVISLPAAEAETDTVRVVARDADKNVLDVWTLDGINLARKMKETHGDKVRKAQEKFNNLTETSDFSEAPEEERDNLKHVWTPLNETVAPSPAFNVSLTVSVNQLGLVSVEKAVAGWEELTVQETTSTKTFTQPPQSTETTGDTSTDEQQQSTDGQQSTEQQQQSEEGQQSEGGEGESKTTSTSTTTTTTLPVKKFTKHNFLETISKQVKQLTITFHEIADDSKELKADEKKKLKKPYPMTPRQVRDARNGLRQMIKSDREVEKLNEMKNRFETYIYDVRARIRDDEDVLRVSTDKERTKLTDLLQEHEDWLYEQGGLNANFTTVEKKLQAVKDAVKDVLERAKELRGRGELLSKVQRQVDDAGKKIAQLQEAKAWLKDPALVKPVTEAIEKFNKWFAETKSAQEKLADTVAPLLTKAAVDAQWKAVADAVSAFSKTRKPKKDEL